MCGIGRRTLRSLQGLDHATGLEGFDLLGGWDVWEGNILWELISDLWCRHCDRFVWNCGGGLALRLFCEEECKFGFLKKLKVKCEWRGRGVMELKWIRTLWIDDVVSLDLSFDSLQHETLCMEEEEKQKVGEEVYIHSERQKEADRN